MTAAPTQTDKVLKVLQHEGVRYVVIGGVAAALHGSPYLTYDLDICVDRQPENLAALAGALHKLDAKEWDPRKDDVVELDWSSDLLAGDTTWLLVTKYGALDILLAPSGSGGYADLRRSQTMIELGELEVPVASLTDLIRMKESAGRERDRQHLPTLRKLLDRVWDRDPSD